MKLYTFQPLFVYQCLEELGYFHPFSLYERDSFLKDEIVSENSHWAFTNSYDWLKEQMLEQGVQYSFNNSHMIWGWNQWSGVNKPKPDKRYSSVFNYSENPYVLMELEVAPERVCLSDYDAWHSVLNYWMLDKEEKVKLFEKDFNFYRQKPLSNIEAHKKMVETWKTIFDLKKSMDILEIIPTEQCIQATFFEIFYTDLTEVHFFENKKCTHILKIR